MKLTIQDVYNLGEGLTTLADKELDIKTAFLVSRNHKKIVEEVDTADQLQNKIVLKYQEKELKNGSVRIKKDKFDNYKEDIEELMKQEVDLDLEMIDLDGLNGTIKAKTIIFLEPILVKE